MGLLIRASCVIGVIALYSPVHETPVDTTALAAAATSMRHAAGNLDADSAIKGLAMASQAAQALKAMPADIRGRMLDDAAGLVMPRPGAPGPARHARP